MYRGLAVSLVLYEQQGRDIDMRACLAEITVGQFEAVEGRLDRYFATKQSSEDFSSAMRVADTKMWTAWLSADLGEATSAREAILAAGAAAERAKSRDLGVMGISFTPTGSGAPRSDEDLAVIAERLTDLGGVVGRRGLYLGLHNDEALSRDNARELRYLLSHTTPQQVLFCPDIAWLVRCGVDVAPLLREHSERIRTLHVRQMRQGHWVEGFGDGDIDYRPIDKLVRPLKQDVRVIWEPTYEAETKMTRRVIDDLKLSRQALRRTFAL